MSREAQNVLVLLLVIPVAVMMVNGAYLHHVKSAVFPWLVMAAVSLVALALISTVRDTVSVP